MTALRTRLQHETLERIRANKRRVAQTPMEIECWVCGRRVTMCRIDARASGWKLGRMRTVRRGLQEQVDLCPDCDLGRGVAEGHRP
jgi:hypothetical protein